MELFKLFGTIAIDNSGANKGIDETTDKAENAHPKIAAAFDKIGDAAVKVGKVVATGLAVGSAAIVALTKQSLDSYADYEQLVGGVETLFKQSSDAVMQYAENAYKTAGMSSNEYMETVTSFSASLLQSLDGDTAKAAEKADLAITDMADNANKMGTAMESIQNAYQGFAKQNYTMLDNLKLGYGGTKEEMERLLKDAKKISGIEYDISSYADIVDAIHVVQTEMGITGTTALEASETISGSISSTKAAWQNLLTGFADGNQDLGLLIDNLVESGTTALRNIVPRIAQILSGISAALPQIFSVISAELPAFMESLLPGLIDGAMALITGLVQALPAILAILLAQVPNILSQLASALITAFPVLLETVKDLFGQIWDYIAVELLGTEHDFESSFAKIQEIFENLWSVLTTVWETIGQPIWNLIQDAIGIVRDAFSEKMPEIQEFVSQCFEDIGKFWEDNLKPCLEAIGNFIENVLAPVFKEVFEVLIKGNIDNCLTFFQNWWNDSLKPIFTGITDFLTGVFTLNWEQAWNGIVSIFTGIVNIIPTILEAVINTGINIVNGLIAGINKVLGFFGLDEIESISANIKVSLPRFETEAYNANAESGTSEKGKAGLLEGSSANASLHTLAKGGVLEKGQVGLLEGNGAEAVVPLDQNRAWISAVAQDMKTSVSGVGNNHEVQELKESFQDFVHDLPEMLLDAFASMKFDVNNREFARMVKAVN